MIREPQFIITYYRANCEKFAWFALREEDAAGGALCKAHSSEHTARPSIVLYTVMSRESKLAGVILKKNIMYLQTYTASVVYHAVFYYHHEKRRVE